MERSHRGRSFKDCRRRRVYIRRLARKLEFSSALLKAIVTEKTATLWHMAFSENEYAAHYAVSILAMHADEVCRGLAAHCPYVAPEIQKKLCYDPSLEVRRALAGNAHSIPVIRYILLMEEDSAVRIAAIYNSSATKIEIIFGIYDPSEEVREVAVGATLRFEPLSPKEYKTLGEDTSWRVRRKVLELSTSSLELVNSFANDPQAEVREALGRSKLATLETLLILRDDPVPQVKGYARMNMKERFPQGSSEI